jgi:hypothetical protein
MRRFRPAICTLMLTWLVGCSQSYWADKAITVSNCHFALAQVTDPVLVAKVASESHTPSVRRAAVERMDDQPFLAERAFEDKDRNVREAAVKQLTDEHLLLEVALRAPDADTRLVAVQRLTGTQSLVKVVREARSNAVLRAAVQCISDQAALEKLLTCKDERLACSYIARREAAMKITDPNLLVLLARHDGDAVVRQTAVKAVTDQTVLSTIACGDNDVTVASLAIRRLSDPALLDEVYRSAKHPVNRRFADARLAAMAPWPDNSKGGTLTALVNKLNRMVLDKRIVSRTGPLSVTLFWGDSSKEYTTTPFREQHYRHATIDHVVYGESIRIVIAKQDASNLVDQRFRTEFPGQTTKRTEMSCARVYLPVIMELLLAKAELTQEELGLLAMDTHALGETRLASISLLAEPGLLSRIAENADDNILRATARNRLAETRKAISESQPNDAP